MVALLESGAGGVDKEDLSGVSMLGAESGSRHTPWSLIIASAILEMVKNRSFRELARWLSSSEYALLLLRTHV